MIAACARVLLTSPKKTMSSAWSIGRLTSITISPSTLVTDSTTPPAGMRKSTPLVLDQSVSVSTEDEEEFEEESGLERRGDSPQRLVNKLDIGGTGDGDHEREEWAERLGELAKDGAGDKVQDREKGPERLGDKLANDGADKPFSATFSAFSAKGKPDMSGSITKRFSSFSDTSFFDSSIASEISVTAKLSGPIGMTLGLNPALTEVNLKGTEKDTFNSIEPEKLKLTEPSIPSESLKGKKLAIDNTNFQNFTETKRCSTSND